MKTCSDCGKGFNSPDHKHLIRDKVLCDDCYKEYQEFIKDSGSPLEKDNNSPGGDSKVFERIEELERKKRELEQEKNLDNFDTSKVGGRDKSKNLAILLTILIMGAGHLYIGKFGRGIGLFFLTFFFSFLAVFNPLWWVFIGGLYIFAVYDIISHFKRNNNGNSSSKRKPNVLVKLIVGIIAFALIFNGVNTLLDSEGVTKKEDSQKVYLLNQEIPVDYLSYRITKAESFTKMGSSIFEKETTGKFIKVYLDITNEDKETKDIFSPRFKIEDSQGRRFDRLSDDMLYISDYIGFGEQLQPGLTVSGAVVFELPKDAKELKLIIAGDWLSETEVIVDLESIKSIGQDTTQKDALIDEITNQCNSPFKCSESCPEYLDVGQKDCSSGELCCMDQS